MELTTLTDALLSTQVPWLPEPVVLRWGLRLCWGIVLAALMLWLGRRWPRPVQWGLLVLLGLWSLVPGPLSPAYWLGLAFQTPSLMTTGICLVWGVTQLQSGSRQRLNPVRQYALRWLAGAGIVLGWLLLLDTFAVLPVSLYAVGFSPAAVAAAALVACLPWVLFGTRHPASVVSWGLGSVLLLYVLLRLPSGNLWDALLDPWLWVGLHGVLIRHFWLKARSAPAATRV